MWGGYGADRPFRAGPAVDETSSRQGRRPRTWALPHLPRQVVRRANLEPSFVVIE